MKFEEAKIRHLLAPIVSVYSAVTAVLEDYGLLKPLTLTDAFNGFVLSVMLLALAIFVLWKLRRPRNLREHHIAYSLSHFLGIFAFLCIAWVSVASIPLTVLAGNLYEVHIAAARNVEFVPIAFGFVALTWLAAARFLPALPVREAVE